MIAASASASDSNAVVAARPAALGRDAYRRFVSVTTRWADNDVYGHLNNVVYYGLFDTAVNAVLIEAGVLDPARGRVVGFVVETHCNFFTPLAFPQPLECGIAVGRIGTTSVRYELGIFAVGAAETAARGHFVHAYVDRDTHRPVPLPAHLLEIVRALK